MDRGKIIFLNGVSSSGKSTLAKELIKVMPDYFHMSIDDYDIFIEKMEDRENKHLIPIETEYFFHRTIAMFSNKGVNLVIDHILHDDFTNEDFWKVLKDYPLLLVGVNCPIEELERREKARGDRELGLARKQLEYVHKDVTYDIEINTYEESVEECTKKVVKIVNDIKSINR